MKTFQITRPDETIRKALTDKINNLTKPKALWEHLKNWPCRSGLSSKHLLPS